ncbi:hypothetical protein GA0115254_111619 [Streptomyces sp. Ncost-T10-10d]|nr:hypothetical protein GA0115254_111619 [Streptomyces sp. Ncost-T10-10d]
MIDLGSDRQAFTADLPPVYVDLRAQGPVQWVRPPGRP